uniref:Uncharacterized protein n=1 Tax=Lactuca sativa TaxID=4236 RepID=A0A9R1X5C6_LACSA|nr:hypothetical protein LSAT_V11C600308540 [Lactuca sativa]
MNKPFCYSYDVHHVFENIDFVGMSYNEFVGFLERFTQDKCEKLYYYQPDLQIPEGLTFISNELYQEFIDIAYRSGIQVLVYMDHFGTTVHVTKANENENEDNCYVKSNMSIEGEEGIDLTDFMNTQQSNMEGVTYEGVSQANGNEDATEGDPKYGEDENIPHVKGKQMFNEDISWKKHILILGMRFTNPKQLKCMLCNYVVANGRAKKHAMSLVEGTIMENYAKLWSYGEEIKRSNPGSTVKLSVNSMLEGKKNFQEDMHLEGGFGQTLMSDQHNGIIEAVKDLFPEIEHRQCVGMGCDAVGNGLSKSINNVILDARKKPIITMLEDIRLYVMQKMCTLRQKGSG